MDFIYNSRVDLNLALINFVVTFIIPHEWQIILQDTS